MLILTNLLKNEDLKKQKRIEKEQRFMQVQMKQKRRDRLIKE